MKNYNPNVPVVLFFKSILTATNVLKDQLIYILNSKILSIKDYEKNTKVDYSFENYLACPTFINGHDHLLGSYHPRIGPRKPYFNWKPWDDDLKNSEIYKERSKISNLDLYYLGCFRNLISGAVTVSDHIPHIINADFISKMPIRVISNYSVAHEISSFELKWGKPFEEEHEEAVQKKQPFITHIEEGFDAESMKGIKYLLEKNSLSEHTVLIHAIGISDEDIKIIAKHNANLVWCPTSNDFMFHRSARIKEILNAGINVSLGTDSPMSGGVNILEEMHFAQNSYYQMYHESISDETLFRMLTCNPAKAFFLKDCGAIEVNKLADFFLIKLDKFYKNSKSYYSLITHSSLEDIAMIFFEGKPIYALDKFSEVFKFFNLTWNSFYLKNTKRIIQNPWDPLTLLKRIRENLNFNKEFPFLPIR